MTTKYFIARIIAGLICTLMVMGPGRSRRSTYRRARLFYRTAHYFFQTSALPLARCMNSIAMLERPGDPGINELNVALAERGLTSEPVRELGTEIDSLCLFIEYPGSGHAVIGALLDTHPDIVIAQELNLLRMPTQSILQSRRGQAPSSVLLLMHRESRR